MKKISLLLIALIVGVFAMEISAQPLKARRNQIYDNLPATFQQLGDSKMYYSIESRWFAGVQRLFSSDSPGYQYAISILGEIDNKYYPCTYGDDERDDGCGSGFLAALKVNNYDAVYVNCETGTTSHGVTMTARVEAGGDVAARIIYTLTNTNNQAVTISAGVYGDIMIGLNDYAPLERLVHEGDTYGMKMKESQADNSALFCALFGEGVTGVTPADDLWFGQFDHNFHADQIVGNYSDVIVDHLIWWDDIDEYYMEENGDYDSALGFCWKNRSIPAHESIELSYIISVGEIEYEEPFVPGDDLFEYEVEATNFEGWNDLSLAHPAHVFGYYEHPYGQNGYIEYMVDATRGEWTRIETPLISGEEFDLPFDMYFDEDITTTHTLSLRFNDGLDNIVEMNGLSWTDVRSLPVSGLEDRVYNGEPQLYNVTVGEETFVIGENDEYIYPGTYTYSYYGNYDEATIGVNSTEFNITRAQAEVEVIIPEDVVYDGNAHGATVNLIKGDGEVIVTYVNTETNESSTEAPTEPGTYAVWVEVTDGQYYDGIANTKYGEFSILKDQAVIEVVVPEDVEYDGEAHAATYELIKGDGEVIVTYVDANGNLYDEAPTEVGVYSVFVEVLDSDHFKGIENTLYGQFEIYSTATGVNEIAVDNNRDNVWYTIDGRRVAAPSAPGIYIHNGRKYLLK